MNRHIKKKYITKCAKNSNTKVNKIYKNEIYLKITANTITVSAILQLLCS